MNRTDDISKLFGKFGASAESYHEFESQVDYKEKEQVPEVKITPPSPEITPVPVPVPEVAPVAVDEVLGKAVETPQSAPHIPGELKRAEPLASVPAADSSSLPDPERVSDTPDAPAPATLITKRFVLPDVLEASDAPEILVVPDQAIELCGEHPGEQLTPATPPATAPGKLRNLLAEVVQAREAEAQALADEALRQASARGRPVKCKAHIVVMVSLKGGVGKTTLGAALASRFRLEGGRTLAIDLDPQNALQYHLGVEHSVSGIGSLNMAGHSWNDRLQQGFDDALLLPYGVLSADEHHALTQELNEDRHWLARHLDSMDLGENDVVVIDTPTGSTPALAQALDVADEVIVVTTADASSFITLDQIDRLLGAPDARAAYSHCNYVVNQFDATRQFSRDMLQVLKRRLGSELMAVVSLDNTLGEALAYGRNPLSASEPCAACEDVLLLAEKLKARFEASRAQGIAAQ